MSDDEVRAYYDRHTPEFLSRGQGGAHGSIHRAVWGPGVASREQAFHYVEERIADVIRAQALLATGSLHVCDLGCGVGASLCYLAERLPIFATGITISGAQVELAAERIRAAGLADRVVCVQSSYQALPPDMPAVSVAYAIESFVHASSPNAFFAECRRLLVPHGALVLCDDFRRQSAGSQEAMTAIHRFHQGWHADTLLDRQELTTLAAGHGFILETATDFTPWLELHRSRDRLLAFGAGLVNGLLHLTGGGRQSAIGRWVYRRWGHWLGGVALQTCLSRGWIGYEFLVFRRV